jgi:hypothetical protein
LAKEDEMQGITESKAMSILQAGALDQYNEDCSDVAIALISHRAPSWTPTGSLRNDSPLAQTLHLVATQPPDMCSGFESGRSDVLEYLTARRTLWELGVSLAILGMGSVRQDELRRLTTDQFWKSQYLLHVAALFKSKGLAVTFVEEAKHPTPDLKVDGWFVECKERNCGTATKDYFGAMFAKSKEKFNKSQYRPGLVAYDIVPDNLFAPEGVNLETHYKQLGQTAFAELRKLKGVEAAVITVRRLLSRNQDKVGFPTVWMCLVRDAQEAPSFRQTWSKVFRFIWTEEDFE